MLLNSNSNELTLLVPPRSLPFSSLASGLCPCPRFSERRSSLSESLSRQPSTKRGSSTTCSTTGRERTQSQTQPNVSSLTSRRAHRLRLLSEAEPRFLLFPGQHTVTGTSSSRTKTLEALKNQRGEKKERQSRKVRSSSTSPSFHHCPLISAF